MIKYNPTHHKYAGDANMGPATHHNQSEIYKRKCDTMLERGRHLSEEFQFYNFEKTPKKPSIAEVPIHVCVEISHS